MTESRAKYGNTRTLGDDGQTTYDSKLERDVARVLDALQATGRIQRYERQVRYELLPPRRGYHVIALYVDFRATQPDGRTVLLECKGTETPVWRLKRRLFADRYIDPLVVIRRPEDVIAALEQTTEAGAGRGARGGD